MKKLLIAGMMTLLLSTTVFTQHQASASSFTPGHAIKYKAAYTNGSTKGKQFRYHVDHKEGKYYIVQYYEVMPDHIATIAWYAVDKKKKKAYDITYGWGKVKHPTYKEEPKKSDRSHVVL